MLEKFRRDSLGMGILIGIFLPGVLFAILFVVLLILQKYNPAIPTHIIVPKLILIALLPSLFILRHYLLKLKYDLTGRGIIIATFVWALAFVIVQFTI